MESLILFIWYFRNKSQSFYSSLQVRKMADETGLDFSDQIVSLEGKYQQVTTFYNFETFT